MRLRRLAALGAATTVSVFAALTSTAAAGTVAEVPINQSGCSGRVNIDAPYWGNVKGGAYITCPGNGDARWAPSYHAEFRENGPWVIKSDYWLATRSTFFVQVVDFPTRPWVAGRNYQMCLTVKNVFGGVMVDRCVSYRP